MATLSEIRELYHLPLLDLIYRAATVQREAQVHREVQLCTLLSVKTGGCAENCGYCSQSAHYKTQVKRESLMDVDVVLAEARKAKEEGATRFCMGAAWREVKDGPDFENVLKMVSGVREYNLEVCCTLGMINEEQAKRLKDAGLTAYNHNLDTSERKYGDVVSTRTYQDRLRTIKNVSHAGISVCCGGILGLGESIEDRIELLHSLTKLDPQPESVPINALVPVEGTPMEGHSPVDPFDFIRMIACARVLLPKTKVRLSAGRLTLSREAQALAFLAGANSIFTGEKLLTTANPSWDSDHALLEALGLKPLKPFERPGLEAHQPQ